MPQDRETGATANAYGRATARRVARAIGATMRGTASNEAVWEGRRIVIKCARATTAGIGVTYRMLGYIDAVIAAFERMDGMYDLYELTPNLYESLMRPTASQGASNGRVGIVRRRDIERLARPLKTIKVTDRTT